MASYPVVAAKDGGNFRGETAKSLGLQALGRFWKIGWVSTVTHFVLMLAFFVLFLRWLNFFVRKCKYCRSPAYDRSLYVRSGLANDLQRL